MEYRQHQLANGLTILAECNPRSYLTAFGYFVKAGSRDECSQIGGVSHFLEHMVFKGTPQRTADQVNQELDDMGSSSNARTGEESTVYHAAVLPEFQTQMIDLLSDLMRPSLRDDDFETEKKVIIEEIMMYQDQPPYGGHEQIMASFFGEHPLGQSVLGTVESVSGLTPEMMHNYFRQRYCPSNMAIAAAGQVDFDRLVEDVDRCCGHWSPADTNRDRQTATVNLGFEQLHKPNSHQQYILQLSPGPSCQDSQRYASRVATTIMGDDSGSRMYWEFIDTGLAESAGTGSYEYHQNGLVMTYLCCAPEDAQQVLQRLAELQIQFRESGVSQKELELAKQKIASHIVLASERTESRMYSVGAQWLSDQPFQTVAEIARRYESLTLEDVNQAIQDYPLYQNMSLTVGPRNDLCAPTL